MPIEIKELVIRVTLDNPDAAEDGAPGRGASPASPASVGPDPAAQQAMVQECVRQVLQILARERER